MASHSVSVCLSDLRRFKANSEIIFCIYKQLKNIYQGWKPTFQGLPWQFLFLSNPYHNPEIMERHNFYG
ncbi:hypothetical protein QUF72_19640, partial [Desulfobacterales bacterium HSG2]|nr:hypothetical protein [Desulfobacterales bacterium HSG2]